MLLKLSVLILGSMAFFFSPNLASAQFVGVSIGGFYPGVNVGVGPGFHGFGGYSGYGYGYGPGVSVNVGPRYFAPAYAPVYIAHRPYAYSYVRPVPVVKYRQTTRVYRRR